MIVVAGRVQGVGYRAFTHKAAARLDLVGGVKNLPDGRVEVVAEGSKGTLEEFLQILKQGPPLSSVSEMQVRWTEARGEYDDFAIWY